MKTPMETQTPRPGRWLLSGCICKIILYPNTWGIMVDHDMKMTLRLVERDACGSVSLTYMLTAFAHHRNC